MNPPLPEEKLALVNEALYWGDKIEAIKQYREETQASLADSKRAVEEWEVELRRVAPEKFVAGSGARNWVLLNLVTYSVAAGALAIICVDSIVRQSRGVEHVSLRTWLTWVFLAGAIYNAHFAYRRLRKLAGKA